MNIAFILGSIQFNNTEITYNFTQYYMANHAILLNITCMLRSIQYSITQYSMGFINITQYFRDR